jgi:hypothetical protein
MRWLAAAALLLQGAQQEDPEKKAQKLFEQAEALMKQYKFEEARAYYALIAKKYDSTKVADLARYRAGDNCLIGWDLIHHSGPTFNRIDVVFMGDSYLYTDADQRSFGSLAKANMMAMFEEPAFKEYRPYFNYWRVYLASKESGTSTPDKTFDTALGGRVDGGRYGINAVKAMEITKHLPVNDGNWIMIIRHGGGTPMAGVLYAGEAGVLVHEFGHTFGGLGDEYTSEGGEGGAGIQRGINRQYNLSDVPDPDKAPWAHWFARAEYARALGIGMHEGGNAQKKGQWRPTPGNCAMNSGGQFCAVCREQILIMIYNRVNPIDDSTPHTKGPMLLKLKKSGDGFAVADLKLVPWIMPLQPATHRLTVKWALKRTGDPVVTATSDKKGTEPPPPPPDDPYNKVTPARPDEPIQSERTCTKIPFEGDVLPSVLRADTKGRAVESPDLSKAKLRPGTYLLTVEVKDDIAYENVRDPLTKQKVRVPWVVKDEMSLLTERRAWELIVEE